MTKEVKVSVIGSEYGASEQEQVEEITKGNYYQKNGKDFLIYDALEGEELIHTTVNIEKDQVEITKSGTSSRVHMRFKEGEKFSTTYDTAAGALAMEFDTTELNCCFQEDCIIVEIVYDIYMNGIKINKRKIMIQIEKITK